MSKFSQDSDGVPVVLLDLGDRIRLTGSRWPDGLRGREVLIFEIEADGDGAFLEPEGVRNYAGRYDGPGRDEAAHVEGYEWELVG